MNPFLHKEIVFKKFRTKITNLYYRYEDRLDDIIISFYIYSSISTQNISPVYISINHKSPNQNQLNRYPSLLYLLRTGSGCTIIEKQLVPYHSSCSDHHLCLLVCFFVSWMYRYYIILHFIIDCQFIISIASKLWNLMTYVINGIGDSNFRIVRRLCDEI
jgi:hypothetical protein